MEEEKRFWKQSMTEMVEEIVRMVEGIQNKGTLEYLYTFIKLFLEKWG